MKTTLHVYCTNKQMGEQAARNFKSYVYRLCKEIQKGERNHLYTTETLDTLYTKWLSCNRTAAPAPDPAPDPVQAVAEEMREDAAATRNMLRLIIACAFTAAALLLLGDIICHLLNL